MLTGGFVEINSPPGLMKCHLFRLDNTKLRAGGVPTKGGACRCVVKDIRAGLSVGIHRMPVKN